MKRKLLAGVLSLCMIFSLIPVGAFAAFDDTNGHWGAASAERWSQVGVLNGDDTGNFNPDKQMTRAEFAQMLCNLMGYTEKAPNNFSDVPNDAWYADAILKLVAAGVMNGVSDTSAAPQAPITREQAAVLLCRAMNITPSANASVTFSDAGSVSSWAKDAVAALTERGMINGVGNNNFAPANNIVRAAVAQMVDNMVAEYVTQSGATVTGEVKGVVIIKADNVKIEDATLAENVIVAPAAENATVTLTGSTQAAGVVVGAEGAKVVVDSTATAESVTVDAPKAQTEIAGKVDTVAVTENAESAKTTVAKDAEVKTVTVDAPKAETQVSGKVDTVAVAQNAESAKTTVAKDAEVTNVTVAAPKADTSISGTVSKVDVAQSATGANVTANAGAKVDSVTTAANDVKVNGADNTIGTVTTTGGTADVTSKGTEVKNEGADKVTVDGNKDVPKGDSTTSDKTPTTPSGGGSSGGSSGGNQPAEADVVKAPMGDHFATEANRISADKLGTVTVSGTVTDATNNVNAVTITGTNILKHNNTQQTDAANAHYWVGFGVPYAGEHTFWDCTANTDGTQITTAKGRTITENNKEYTTIYFDEDAVGTTQVIKVKSGENVVATYNVTVSITPWKLADSAVTVTDEIPANHADNGNAENDIKSVCSSAANINKVGKNYTVTLNGELDTEKLVTADGGKYSYFFMTVTNPDSAIFNNAMVDNAAGSPGGFIADYTNGQAAATMVLKDNSLLTKTYEFQIKDKAERVQDTFTVTVNAIGCTITGAGAKVTFVDDDGTPVGAAFANQDKKVTPPTVAKAGYDLSWVRTNNGTDVVNFDTATFDTATTIYAKWTAKTYTVTYNLNGGTGTAPAEANATYGQPFTLANGTGLTKTGFTFDGWSLTANGPKVTSPINPWNYVENKIFYAVWKPNTYTVNVTGATGNGVTVSHGGKLTQEQINTLIASAPARDNYAVKELKNDSSPVTTDTVFTAAATLTPVYESKATITAVTGKFTDTKFGGEIDVDKFQAITLGAEGFTLNAQKSRYEATATGDVYFNVFDKFSSNAAEKNGYYVFLRLTVPATVKDTAVVKYNNVTMTASDFDSDGNLTMITRITPEEMIATKGIKVEVDWDGSGANVATTYVVKFDGLKPSIKADGATALTVTPNKNKDDNDDIRTEGENSYICFQVKKDNVIFPIKTGEILAAGTVGTDNKVTMRTLWTTGESGNKPTGPSLELPRADIEDTDADYAHHVGMTFMQGDGAQTVNYLFVAKDGKVYSATFNVPAKTTDNAGGGA